MTQDARRKDMQAEIEALGPWFHNLHLPGGIETAPEHPLGDFPAVKWRQLAPHLPERLDGWRALDIGCNAGFYSFELARRGALVTAIDHDEHYLAQARWAAGHFPFADRIRFEEGDVYGLSGPARRDYDLVLFLGVLYHLRYPLLALDTIARLAPRTLVLQTLTSDEEPEIEPGQDLDFTTRGRLAAPGFPRMSFIEGTFCGDPTNWWAPNRSCVLAMLRSAGFDVAAEPGHELFIAVPRQGGLSPHQQAQWDAVTKRAGGRGRSEEQRS